MAQDEIFNFIIVDNKGKEARLNEQFESLHAIYENVITFKTKDSKYGLSCLLNNFEAIVDRYDILQTHNSLSKIFILITNNDDKLVRNLMNSRGEIIINKYSSYFPIRVYEPNSTSEYETFYQCSMNNEKEYLVKKFGEIVNKEGYFNINTLFEGKLVECISKGSDIKHYINSAGNSFAVNSLHYKALFSDNDFIVIQNVKNLRKEILFADEKQEAIKNIDSISHLNGTLYKHQKEGQAVYFINTGQIIYTDSDNTQFDIILTKNNFNDYYVLFNKEKSEYIITYEIGNKKQCLLKMKS